MCSTGTMSHIGWRQLACFSSAARRAVTGNARRQLPFAGEHEMHDMFAFPTFSKVFDFNVQPPGFEFPRWRSCHRVKTYGFPTVFQGLPRAPDSRRLGQLARQVGLQPWNAQNLCFPTIFNVVCYFSMFSVISYVFPQTSVA